MPWKYYPRCAQGALIGLDANVAPTISSTGFLKVVLLLLIGEALPFDVARTSEYRQASLFRY
jgi:hypothetical protein